MRKTRRRVSRKKMKPRAVYRAAGEAQFFEGFVPADPVKASSMIGDFCVAISACPRPYIDQMFLTFDRAGLSSVPVKLFFDGEEKELKDSCKCMPKYVKYEVHDGPRLGSGGNQYRCFRWMVSLGKKYGILLEDDVLLAENFLLETARWVMDLPEDWAIGQLIVPSFIVYSYPTNATFFKPLRGQFYGFQAVVLNCDMLKGYVDFYTSGAHDIEMREYAYNNGYAVYSHVPSIGEHIGVVSTHGRGPYGMAETGFPVLDDAIEKTLECWKKKNGKPLLPSI